MSETIMVKSHTNKLTKEMLLDFYYTVEDYYEQNIEWGDEFHRGKEKAYEAVLKLLDDLLPRLGVDK